MISILLHHPFETFGRSHLVVILITVLLAVGLTRHARKGDHEVHLKCIRVTLGTLLIVAVMLDPVLTLVRYGWNSHGWELVIASALPFYLCDVVSILLALALFTKNQRLSEIGYLWGLAASLQGLLSPTLRFGYHELEFYAFFLQHGGAPLAAVFLVWGLGIRPESGAFRRAVIWSLAYLAVIMTLNFAIDENYGFLNAKPTVATPFDYLGPWPYYLITLQVIAYTLYAILLAIAPRAKTRQSSPP